MRKKNADLNKHGCAFKKLKLGDYIKIYVYHLVILRQCAVAEKQSIFANGAAPLR